MHLPVTTLPRPDKRGPHWTVRRNYPYRGTSDRLGLRSKYVLDPQRASDPLRDPDFQRLIGLLQCPLCALIGGDIGIAGDESAARHRIAQRTPPPMNT